MPMNLSTRLPLLSCRMGVWAHTAQSRGWVRPSALATFSSLLRERRIGDSVTSLNRMCVVPAG
jgi:hypothetical protein